MNATFCYDSTIMRRHITNQLLAWKQRKDHKPLILMGIRQVGKTYHLQQFGKDHYAHCIYVNFEINPALCQTFRQELNPQRLIQAMAAEANLPMSQITPENTLFILDEIQECPEALNSLKYFCENCPEYAVCAAGSLLGVTLANTRGFPVGKVDFLQLNPVSFIEFLSALGEQALVEHIEGITALEPIPENMHQKLLNNFSEYLFVGGMPAAVNQYAATRDIHAVREIQLNILQAYQLDFAKHVPADHVMKITQVWRSIPTQLAKENKKFVYSVIRQGARAREFETAIQWLTEAGLIHKVYSVSKPCVPLSAYAQFDYFKIYLADVGLLAAMVNLPINSLFKRDQVLVEFQGAFVENYAAQVLHEQQRQAYYWCSEGKAEVDFIIEQPDKIIPLEIKSGSGTKKKSLQIYSKKYNPDCIVRGSTMNLTKDGDFINCPLYLLEQLPRWL